MRSHVPLGQRASNMAISSSVPVCHSPAAYFFIRRVGSSARHPLSMAKWIKTRIFFRRSLAAPGVSARLAIMRLTCSRRISTTSRCPNFFSGGSGGAEESARNSAPASRPVPVI